MSNDRNKGRLLADILAEDSDAGLRDALFGQTLRMVRRQRRWRVVRRAGSVALLLIVPTLLAVHFFTPHRHSIRFAQPAPQSAYALIHSQSLDASNIVTTQPLLPTGEVASSRFAQIVTTEASHPPLVEISDDQLLDLAKGAAVALVRETPHQAELIFLNDEDREKFFHN